MGNFSELSTLSKIAVSILFITPMIVTCVVFYSLTPTMEKYEAPTGYVAIIPGVEYETLIQEFSEAHKVEESDTEQISEPAVPKMKINSCYSALSRSLNTYLYDVCEQYASGMKCKGVTLSPLLALAEANLEGGRVDTSQTFSALANSSVYTFNSVEELKDFDVTRVLDSKETWLRMSSEYSTRDRGALQCNPNYSLDKTSYGKSEKELLDAYIAKNGIPDYGTNRDSCGNTFDVQAWINNSRTKHGDRFNVASMVQMFVDEKTSIEIPLIEKNFQKIQNEYHVYSIMAYNHWIGNGFMTMSRDKAYSGFKTIGRAYEYCEDISSAKAIEIIYSQCYQDIQNARRSGSNPPKCLDNSSSKRIFNLLAENGVCKDWDYYFRHKRTGSWDQGDTACLYGLGIIYGVMQMNMLYSGN